MTALNSILHTPGVIGLLVVSLVLVGVAAARFGRRRPWLAQMRPSALMTENETSFFLRLERALPAYRVFPQVSFTSFLGEDGKLGEKQRWSVRAWFDRKVADFVICQRGTMQIIALIELDDRGHHARADRRRDELTVAAGYKTLRFPTKQKPTEAEIAERFRQLIS